MIWSLADGLRGGEVAFFKAYWSSALAWSLPQQDLIVKSDPCGLSKTNKQKKLMNERWNEQKEGSDGNMTLALSQIPLNGGSALTDPGSKNTRLRVSCFQNENI